MTDEIFNIIYSTLNEIGKMNGLKIPEELNLQTNIIGSGGVLDSLAFVSFIVAVEQKINQQFNRHISLNSEKAFSQKQNPFRSVNTLMKYIVDNWDDEDKAK